MAIDPVMVAKIQAKARMDRQIVDRYNAELLASQGIEPTQARLQELCMHNIAAAFAAEAEAEAVKRRLSSNA